MGGRPQQCGAAPSATAAGRATGRVLHTAEGREGDMGWEWVRSGMEPWPPSPSFSLFSAGLRVTQRHSASVTPALRLIRRAPKRGPEGEGHTSWARPRPTAVQPDDGAAPREVLRRQLGRRQVQRSHAPAKGSAGEPGRGCRGPAIGLGRLPP